MRFPGGFVGGRVLVSVLAVLAIGLAPAPAWAHGDDPTLVANPTDTPLTVFDPDGVGFLRVSSAGVFGNVAAGGSHRVFTPRAGDNVLDI